MPALPGPLLDNLASAYYNIRSSPPPTNINATNPGINVVCAWPVSGQYGPGSRSLYYALVAACIFARKVEWLRNACLAAALLFPVIAALHGIVLAAVHVDGAVDLDVYGAFQLCAIGILVAPMTARVSRTYFKDHGRNTIFVWSIFVVAGLLSLVVEFFRLESFPCTHDDFGNPISNDPAKFPYGSATCGILCDQDKGPFSPIRGGSADNIYLVPAPTKLNYHAAILVAAACCIPGILLAVSLGFQLFKNSWATRWGRAELNLRASVILCEPEVGIPTMADLRGQYGSSLNLGVIRLQAQHPKMDDGSPVSANRMRHVEDVTENSSRTSIAIGSATSLLHSLHSQSMLTTYTFEVGRSKVQLLEINFDSSAPDILAQLYTELLNLEREDVDVIFIEAHANDPASEEVMAKLREDSEINKEVSPGRTNTDFTKSLGKILQIVLFGGAVLAILIAGERNLFSSQVRYQTEPMANIGQWAPVSGTALAVLGSVWLLFADAMREERRLQRYPEQEELSRPSRYLQKVVRTLIVFSDILRPARKHFDDSGFKKSTTRYPTTPGQQWRDPDLHQTFSNYAGSHRASDESLHSTYSERPPATDDIVPAFGRVRSGTEGAPRRRETLELPERPSLAHRPHRRSTQNSLPPSPLEPVRTLHESSGPETPDIVVFANNET